MLPDILADGLGPVAWKTALNIVSVVVFGGAAVRFGAWWWRDRGSLQRLALGSLPLSVALLMTFSALSAALYGANRFVMNAGGPDLRDYPLPASLLGVAALFAVAYHMTALWRAEGLPVRPRVIRCAVLIALAWAGLTWVLW